MGDAPDSVFDGVSIGDIFHRPALPAKEEAQVEVGRSRREPSPTQRPSAGKFVPIEPSSVEETKLPLGEIEALVLKVLLNLGGASGRQIAEQLKLPFGMLAGVFTTLRTQLLIQARNAAMINDYQYELSPTGLERARRCHEQCTYFGAAPVAFDDYAASVPRQSIRAAHPRYADLRQAMADLLLSPEVISHLGQAVHAGRSLLLYGAPGNGKTSIAERLMRSVSHEIWIPRTVAVGREIVRMYDATIHEQLPAADSENLLRTSRIDRRWVRIRRPTVIVGGELTLVHLEFSTDSATGVHEAPLQCKANCGALVIDDFGRQRVEPAELLNRWIVPIEKGFDYLTLPSGRQIRVPFDPLLVFATSGDPKRLFDEAFLRQIPYKVEIKDPSEEDFRLLFEQLAPAAGFRDSREAAEYLVARHFRAVGRPLRFGYVRDILERARNFCEFHERPLELTSEVLDNAVSSFFAGL